MGFIITIDGLSGCGKSCLTEALAKRIGGVAVNTGMMFRAYAWAQETQITPETFSYHSGTYLLNGQQLPYLGSEVWAARASTYAQQPQVRKKILTWQVALANSLPCALFEGRDMGTVVFPKADLKFFLTAALPLRAQRRAAQLQQPLAQVLEKMQARDAADAVRTQPAPDAICIDTSHLTQSGVVDKLEAYYLKCCETG